MPDLGKYAAEVLGAYGLSLFLIAGLIIVTMRKGRRARAELARIEANKDA
ncbi:MAG: heme exporter protein CcmD [Yoonia sp.]